MTAKSKAGLLAWLGFLLIFGIIMSRPGSSPDAGYDPLYDHQPLIDQVVHKNHRPPLTAVLEEPPADQPGDEPGSSSSQEQESTTTAHVVQKSDTLCGIAQKFYGKCDPQLLDWIVRFNEGAVKDVDKISIGQEILLPSLPAPGTESKM